MNFYFGVNNISDMLKLNKIKPLVIIGFGYDLDGYYADLEPFLVSKTPYLIEEPFLESVLAIGKKHSVETEWVTYNE
jgi:hypothetical protein